MELAKRSQIHPAACRQGRTDRAVEAYGAGGVVQERFGDRNPAIGVALDQQRADALGAGGAAGFAGLQRVDAAFA